MSRTGRKPVTVPQGVEVKLADNLLHVKGPKGELERALHPEMVVKFENNEIVVERPSDIKAHKAMHGTTRSLVANMVEGVSTGYQKGLDLVGVGYRAQMQGKKLVLNVGYSHPVEFDPPAGIEIETPAATKVIVRGASKELVGEIAANIRAVREPEPYKGKGIKYETEHIRRKAGKTGK